MAAGTQQYCELHLIHSKVELCDCATYAKLMIENIF